MNKNDMAGSMITRPWELPALCMSSMVAPRPTNMAAVSRYPSSPKKMIRGILAAARASTRGKSVRIITAGRARVDQKASWITPKRKCPMILPCIRSAARTELRITSAIRSRRSCRALIISMLPDVKIRM